MKVVVPRVRFNKTFAFAAASAILIVGLLLGLLSEAAYSREKLRELELQGAILAESVTAPLMFSDGSAARDYTNAFATNPQVERIAIYSATNELLASFARNPADEEATRPQPRVEAAHFNGRYAEITAPAMRDGQTYGTVFLLVQRESLMARLSRYSAIALLVVMAALVLYVAGAAQGDLARANEQLASRANALSAEIEHRKEVEEALLQSRKMEAIGQLTGGVAHDFNNLLMVISGGLKLMEKQTAEDRQRKIKEAMQQAVDRGAGLTRQLLAFGRRQSQQVKTIDVAKQMTGMRELLERSIRADILLDMNFPDALPHIKVDPGEFELSILNLVVNARDAMPKGGVITISAQPAHAESVEVIVRDTGSGIAPEIRDRIFEPYFTTKQVGQGTGLGLSQVYGFVKQSGGEIRIESEMGAGTSIILSLKRSQQALSEPSDQPQQKISGEAKPRTVLMVEDDDAVAETVTAMLRELGHSVTRTASVDDALRELSRGVRYDLVFSDIVMPGGKSGVDLARELETTMPEMPVLLTSGYSGAGIDTTSRPLLRKPYQINDLQDAVMAATGRPLQRA